MSISFFILTCFCHFCDRLLTELTSRVLLSSVLLDEADRWLRPIYVHLSDEAGLIHVQFCDYKLPYLGKHAVKMDSCWM